MVQVKVMQKVEGNTIAVAGAKPATKDKCVRSCPRLRKVYRLRFRTPDPLLLINCTVWLAPCTTMWITPEIEYSLL